MSFYKKHIYTGCRVKAIVFSVCRFSIRGKMEPNTSQNLGGCSFELEICYLPLLGSPSHSNGLTPNKLILKNGTQNCSTPNSCKSDSPSVPFESFVGIRRKRLKGDSWCYKKVCEEVLALTATDFKQTIESAV